MEGGIAEGSKLFDGKLIHERVSLLLSCDQCDFKISRKTDLELHKRFNHSEIQLKLQKVSLSERVGP